MSQEVLVITRDDIRAAHLGSPLGMQVLQLLNKAALRGDPIVIRMDFDHGGLEARPRTLGWLGRLCWWLGSTPMEVGL